MKTLIYISVLLMCHFSLSAQEPLRVSPPTTQPQQPTRQPIQYDAVLVTVNGEPITRFDLLIECGGNDETLKKVLDKDGLDVQIEAYRREMLNNLVDRKLVLREYAKYRYPIPPQMIEDAIDKIAQNIGDGSRDTLKKRLKAMGITETEVRQQAFDRIAAEMMVYEYCHRRIAATPRQCYEYYQAHIDDFTISQQWKIQILHILPSSQNPNADSELNTISKILSQDTQRFDELLQLYGKGFSSREGTFSEFENNALREDFQIALKALPEGKNITQPIVIPEGTLFLKVLARGEPYTRPFNEVRLEIKEAIEFPLRQKQTDAFFKRLRKDAIIRDFSNLIE